MAKRVVLAMSGGVDSSVAAYLLKAQGYEVIGLFMRHGLLPEEDEQRAKTCCSATDALDARRVANRLDIPFYALNFERDFDRIKDYFVDEYVAGRTPNPCVMCNIWLKFGKLWSYGKQVGADHVATGPLRPDRPGGRRDAPGRARRRSVQGPVVRPVRAPAASCCRMSSSRSGNTPKAEIRAIAREQCLPVHDKPESQEICFVPDDDYLAFVRERRPGHDTSGPIVDEDGQILGTHDGIEGFTIGQRRGLGIALGTPRYVVQIEPATRTVTIGERESLERIGLEAGRFNWQGPLPHGPVPLHGPDPLAARGGPGDRRAFARRPCPGRLRFPPDRGHARDRSSPSIRTTWFSGEDGSKGQSARWMQAAWLHPISGLVVIFRKHLPGEDCTLDERRSSRSACHSARFGLF